MKNQVEILRKMSISFTMARKRGETIKFVDTFELDKSVSKHGRTKEKMSRDIFVKNCSVLEFSYKFDSLRSGLQACVCVK